MQSVHLTLGRFILIGFASSVAALSIARPAAAEWRVVNQFLLDPAIHGPVQRATFDGNGRAWLATPRKLFKVQDRSLSLADEGGDDESLVLPTGGGRYAWITSGSAPFGSFNVELVSLDRPGTRIARLRAAGIPAGFGTVHVSSGGKLYVGARPLQNLESLKGEFLYSFWPGAGTPATITLSEPRVGAISDDGESILLYGEADAIALDRQGRPIWTVRGDFRNAVMTGRPPIALLNPRNAIDEVLVVRDGNVAVAKMAAPVHEMAITPDAGMAAVATSGGGLSLVDLNRCNSQKCDVNRIRLAVSQQHTITALRFADDKTLAIALAHEDGVAPAAKYETGEILIVSTDGDELLRKGMNLPQPATVSPLLDVVFRSGRVAAYTRNEVLFIEFRN